MTLRRGHLLVALVLGLAGLVALPATAAAKPGRLGIDVSRFNGTIDWAQVKSAGVTFAFVAASRGSGTDCAVVPASCGADPNYLTNYSLARAAGVRVGPYHRAFVNGATVPEAQADARLEADVFLASVGSLQPKDLRPALDVETPFGGAPTEAVRAWVRAWLKRVRNRLGPRPIVYTNTTSWAGTGSTVEFGRAGYPLWVANWGVRKPSVPANNWAGKGWSVWQFTSSGSIPGISGRVDLNRLRVRFTRISVR
jgi:lysozyme